jgi:hypothetical protein
VTRLAGLLFGAVLLLRGEVLAHELDEYLMASRLAFRSAGIGVEMDLTPGVSVAQDIVKVIDRDGDGRIDGREAHAYARMILARVSLTIDGAPRPLALEHVEIAPVDTLLDGTGSISLVASTAVDMAPGRHHAVLRNDQSSAVAVFLANALIPESPDIVIASQARDTRQREIRVEYQVKSAPPRALWMLAAVAVVGALGARRQRRVR